MRYLFACELSGLGDTNRVGIIDLECAWLLQNEYLKNFF